MHTSRYVFAIGHSATFGPPWPLVAFYGIPSCISRRPLSNFVEIGQTHGQWDRLCCVNSEEST